MSEMARSGRCVVAVDGPSGSGKSDRLPPARRGAGRPVPRHRRDVPGGHLGGAAQRGGAHDADAVAKIAAEVDLRIGTDPRATT